MAVGVRSAYARLYLNEHKYLRQHIGVYRLAVCERLRDSYEYRHTHKLFRVLATIRYMEKWGNHRGI